MRKSKAPSKLNKNEMRAPFFSPPYKNQVPNAKRHCRPITNLSEEAKMSTVSPAQEVSESSTRVRSPADLLNVIKAPLAQEKENLFSKNSSFIPSEEKEHTSPLNKAVDESRDLSRVCSTERERLSTHISSSFDQNKILLNQGVTDSGTRYFSVVWCKLSKKKHKNWEGDAVLIVKGRSVVLKDMEGKEIGRSSGYKLKDLESLEEGNTLPVGAKEIEIQGEIEAKNYVSGKCFQNCVPTFDESEAKSVPLRPKPKPFRLPFRDGLGGRDREDKGIVKPLYNISDASAIVLPKPPAQHQWTYNTSSLSIVDVVLDPHLGCQLRPHQRAGVVFLYECVMGFRFKECKGAILADEMGLGKTLQCIALIWTLLKQGPYGGNSLLKRVLIVTPSSLVSNWGKEFDKWLGKERIRPYLVDQHNRAENFIKQNVSPVLIISYEMLIRCIERIQQMHFDLMLCDEGHRLKNSQIKTTSLLSSLNIKRRIIVTGTPIQNDLRELYSLVEFVNPGILGSSAMFRKVYEEPILRSQQPSAKQEEKEIGESRAAELNRLTSQFTLRRTQEIINKYLPPKTEFVVFCQPSKIQTDLYEAIVGSRGLQKCLTNSEVGDHLAAICILRKLCNHPALLFANENKEHQSEIQSEISNLIPEELSQNIYLEEDSGKLAVVSCFLWSLAECGRERIVIVSNFTTTLNMLQQLCERYKYPFLRLDGSTPSSKRQWLVDKFNSSSCQEIVFLLSAKAGGIGLNLIGASRILLFDVDWNPATDLQAMSRVWRDGQTKNVYIYRLILAGSIEEKIYQRQVCKQGISGSVVDARNNFKVQFSTEELKDLFRFYPDVSSLTHHLLNCPCDQMGGEGRKLSQGSSDERDCQLLGGKVPQHPTTMDQLFSWQHFSIPRGTDMLDDHYLEVGQDFVSFVFKCQVMQENSLFY